MKTFKTVMKEVKEVDTHTCDICGKDIKYRRGFDASYATVEGAIGERYPETDCRKHYKIDMCGNCFERKLIPLIEREFDIVVEAEEND